MQKNPPKVLTIAGSDSGGGAGIQADLKTISALGCYGSSAITALTAQNTEGVHNIYPVNPDFVAEQIDVVMKDIGADAVKIGMLHSAEVMEAISESLQSHGVNNIVLDPVMVAQSGDRLINENAVSVLKEKLIPMAQIVTPNLPEMNLLGQMQISSVGEGDQAACLSEVESWGCEAVLLKGGHDLSEQSTDLLLLPVTGEVIPFVENRIDTRNNHGTGCTLSSAIAAGLAKGESVKQAVSSGKSYVTQGLKKARKLNIGSGHGPLWHF